MFDDGSRGRPNSVRAHLQVPKKSCVAVTSSGTICGKIPQVFMGFIWVMGLEMAKNAIQFHSSEIYAEECAEICCQQISIHVLLGVLSLFLIVKHPLAVSVNLHGPSPFPVVKAVTS